MYKGSNIPPFKIVHVDALTEMAPCLSRQLDQIFSEMMPEIECVQIKSLGYLQDDDCSFKVDYCDLVDVVKVSSASGTLFPYTLTFGDAMYSTDDKPAKTLTSRDVLGNAIPICALPFSPLTIVVDRQGYTGQITIAMNCYGLSKNARDSIIRNPLIISVNVDKDPKRNAMDYTSRTADRDYRTYIVSNGLIRKCL